jgi:hypothetical protein
MPEAIVKVAAVDQNLSLTGAQTVDSIGVSTGDKVLAASQTTQAQNGIYLVNSGGAWTKDADLPVGTIFRQAQGRPRYTKGFWRYAGSQEYRNPPTRKKGRSK